MKRILSIAAAAVCIMSCAPKEDHVMARHVPERSDDFVWENDLVCYRAYGQALEGETTSPGFDIWVKLPVGLVADQRYRDELENGKTYHKDWGNGKDCYKVGVSLGAGASSPYIDGSIRYPSTNWRSFEILEKTQDRVVFTLDYPEWEAADGITVTLSKKFTVISGTPFCKCEDTYSFNGTDSLCIATGVNRHKELGGPVEEFFGEDFYALWENASDTGVEPEDGKIGVAVYVPGAGPSAISEDDTHGICCRRISSGEVLTYYFGSCWSKADIKDWESWISTIESNTWN